MRKALLLQVVWVLITVMLLAACTTQKTPTPGSTSAVSLEGTQISAPSQSPVASVYPGPELPATQDAYPGAEGAPAEGGYPSPQGTATAYAEPANPQPQVAATASPSPQPTPSQTIPPTVPPQTPASPAASPTTTPAPTQTAPATLTPTTITATQAAGYPEPQASTTAGAYPAPATQAAQPTQASQPTQAPQPTQAGAQDTAVAPSPVAEPTSQFTPTATPFLVRTDLIATNPADFKLVSGGYQMVELFASWSPISKSMAPVMNSLALRYQPKINFVFLDIDDPANSFLTALFGSRLPPVFYLLDGQGVVVKSWRGYISPGEFETVFQTLP